MNTIVLFSGGAASYIAAKRQVEKYGKDNVTLLFTDTRQEDADLYRFLKDAETVLGVPVTEQSDGRDVWQVFFDERYLGNSRIDPCSKILKRQQSKKFMAEQDSEATTVTLGITWDEKHRLEKMHRFWEPFKLEAPLTEPPYLTKQDMLGEIRADGIEPPGLYEQGFAHNNCFSGETRFITDSGIKSLESCAGQQVRVLGKGGGWREASVRSFGRQPLMKLTLSRFNDQKVLYCTPDHRWIKRTGRASNNRQETTTKELEPGTRLLSMYGHVRHSVAPSAFGIAHGIVFGDGTRLSADIQNAPASVTLCGDKDQQLLKWFPNSPTVDVKDVGVKVVGLPRYFKDAPPLDESQAYLYGFLAGYFAADGSVSSGQVKLSSSKHEHLSLVRDVCARLGIGTSAIKRHDRLGLGTSLSPLYTVALTPSTLREDFFLIEAHRRAFSEKKRVRPAEWQVVSVEHTDRVEQVYCAVVPEGRVFILEDNLLTGNCGGACVKAGKGQWAQLYREMPERYLYHEHKEEELREYLGKEVAILKERVDGEVRYVTLREFRERLQAEEVSQGELLDVGGCGCFAGGAA